MRFVHNVKWISIAKLAFIFFNRIQSQLRYIRSFASLVKSIWSFVDSIFTIVSYAVPLRNLPYKVIRTRFMKNGTVRKVASYKVQAWPNGNYKASAKHLPLIDPIDHSWGTVPVLNWRGLFNPIDHCTVPRHFSEGFSTAACMAILLPNYPSVIYFHLQLFNRRQTRTIYGLWRKRGYQNVDKKIPQRWRSVIIMSPLYQDWKFWPLIQVLTCSFFEVCS